MANLPASVKSKPQSCALMLQLTLIVDRLCAILANSHKIKWKKSFVDSLGTLVAGPAIQVLLGVGVGGSADKLRLIFSGGFHAFTLITREKHSPDLLFSWTFRERLSIKWKSNSPSFQARKGSYINTKTVNADQACLLQNISDRKQSLH